MLKNERIEQNNRLNKVEEDIENQFGVIDGLKRANCKN